MKLAAYQNYKPSGVEWLGEVPAHWEVKSARFGYSIQLGKMLQPEQGNETETEVPYLKSQHVQWEAIRIDELPTMWASATEEIKYGVKDGDLLVCEGGDVGRAGIITNPPPSTIIQNALHRVRSYKENNLRFLMYVLEHAATQGWFEILCNRSTIAHFTGEKFGALRLPMPSSEEQQTIADFLDTQTAKIDMLLAKKRQLIEKLKEKRSALIARTVTRGLPPDAAQAAGLAPHRAMKDSGVEWLYEVPAHWCVTRLGFLCAKIGSGKTPHGGADVYTDEGIMFLRSQNIYDEGLMLDDVVYITEEVDNEMQGTRVKPRDILLNVTGASLGRTCIVPTEFVYANVNQHVCIIRLVDLNLSSFIAWVLKAPFIKAQIEAIQSGAAREGLNFGQISKFVLALPPPVEQQAIAAYLDRETARIDQLTAKVESAIARLTEYRQALITSAVTGKIDVRGFSAE